MLSCTNLDENDRLVDMFIPQNGPGAFQGYSGVMTRPADRDRRFRRAGLVGSGGFQILRVGSGQIWVIMTRPEPRKPTGSVKNTDSFFHPEVLDGRVLQ